MSEYVFILGAGASRAAGGPLMRDFFDKANCHLPSSTMDSLAGPKPDWLPLNWARFVRARLQIVHSKTDLDLDNLESVWGALELGRLIGQFPGLKSSDDISEAIHNLKRCIALTLTETIRFPFDPTRARYMAHWSYLRFVGLIKALARDGVSRCTLITFNYDVMLDLALIAAEVAFDYCLGPAQGPGSTPLLKLHGSLNWVKCTNCQKDLPPWSLVRLAKSVPLRVPRLNPTPLPIHEEALREVTCPSCHGERSSLETLIVPPAWNKTFGDSLATLWGRAAQELATARHVVVIGYSLPETDSFVRYLFALGLASDTLLEGFWVLDPGKESVGPRFHELLGPAARRRFTSAPVTFIEAPKFLVAEEKLNVPSAWDEWKELDRRFSQPGPGISP